MKPGQSERCNELAIPFPTRFHALTDIQIVQGKTADVSTPNGFERICIDINKGRNGTCSTKKFQKVENCIQKKNLKVE